MRDFRKYFHIEDFELESGARIPGLQLAYHTYGTLNENRSNVIWACHALSGSSAVLDWWNGLFGNDALFTPADYFIICVNVIGSPYGSTIPENLNFPVFSVRDVVKGHELLAEHLEISRIHTLIGASFGGSQALEMAITFTGQVEHLILIAASARESAWAIAIHESQRLALQTDPTFGQIGGGRAGMKAARSMAMLTYRSSDAFNLQQTDEDDRLDDYRAASYMQYQGDKFVQRFDALSYFYLMKCMDSHNVGRRRGGEQQVLERLNMPTLVIGIKSDVLNPPRFQRYLAKHIPAARYEEIDSDFGHDGFLVEHREITNRINDFYEDVHAQQQEKWKVLKFGGKSLANGGALSATIHIIAKESKDLRTAVVVSARGESTALLLSLYQLAIKGQSFESQYEEFCTLQVNGGTDKAITSLLEELNEVLEALALLENDDEFAQDKVLAYGELISAHYVAAALRWQGVQAVMKDARELISTRLVLDEFEVDIIRSEKETQEYFAGLAAGVVPVITGFIARSQEGKTVTLGRNGSNYTATLIGSFLGACEVQNWTNVDGIYSAQPELAPNAVLIREMSYREANELANFGANVLHPKTILPLMQSDIPLRIRNTFNPNGPGTTITKRGAGKGIKAVTVVRDVALVTIEGDGLLGEVGIDARIFSALSKKQITVRLISQAASERGIGFVVNENEAAEAELLLTKEFRDEIRTRQISHISVNPDIAIIAIVGRHNYALETAIRVLRKNRIWMHLISNSISGQHISLVIDKRYVKKAVRVVHNEVFGVIKTLHLFAFGKGLVGKKLLNQIMATPETIVKDRNLAIKVVGVADTTNFVFDASGVGDDWEQRLGNGAPNPGTLKVLREVSGSGLENVVVADNTASDEVAALYYDILGLGFDIVCSNKKANAADLATYRKVRKRLRSAGRLYYYETNVGAGLPIIDTIKHLHHSADKVRAIKGVFSGSMSYVFNVFSNSHDSFTEILQRAKQHGLTEPDPREDLSGIDVARKLIILAREIDLPVELGDVQIENLVPAGLRDLPSYNDLLIKSDDLDAHYAGRRASLPEGHVLRYVGHLDAHGNTLAVELAQVPRDSALGQVSGANAIFEIYTDEYPDRPLIVQGAGAGPGVTARGVYSDLLKIGAQL